MTNTKLEAKTWDNLRLWYKVLKTIQNKFLTESFNKANWFQFIFLRRTIRAIQKNKKAGCLFPPKLKRINYQSVVFIHKT